MMLEPGRVYLGDCRDYSPRIESDSVDLVLTDPPFGIGFKYNSHDDNPRDYEDLIKWTIAESDRVLKPGGLCFVFVAQPQLRHVWPLFPESSRIFAACKNFTQYRPTPVQFGFDPVIFWQKPGDSLIDFFAGKRDWYIGNTSLYVTQDTFHPCPRPLNTIIYMVNNFCPTDGLVVDWFFGSGTTAIAAIETGRRWIGIEKDAEYHRLATERIEQRLKQPFLPGLIEPVRENGKQLAMEGV